MRQTERAQSEEGKNENENKNKKKKVKKKFGTIKQKRMREPRASCNTS